MKGTKGGMLVISRAIRSIEMFTRHAEITNTIKRPVGQLHNELSTIYRNGFRKGVKREAFDQWCLAEDKVCKMIMKIGYMITEEQTGEPIIQCTKHRRLRS